MNRKYAVQNAAFHGWQDEKRMEAKKADKEREKQLFRDGMMLHNLKAKYDEGYTDGFKEGAEPVIRSCFAAVCLALNDLHGFGQSECADILNAVDQHMTKTLSSKEAIDEVWERMGLRLDFKEPFDRIQEL